MSYLPHVLQARITDGSSSGAQVGTEVAGTNVASDQATLIAIL